MDKFSILLHSKVEFFHSNKKYKKNEVCKEATNLHKQLPTVHKNMWSSKPRANWRKRFSETYCHRTLETEYAGLSLPPLVDLFDFPI
jgi:hypothetical protein